MLKNSAYLKRMHCKTTRDGKDTQESGGGWWALPGSKEEVLKLKANTLLINEMCKGGQGS